MIGAKGAYINKNVSGFSVPHLIMPNFDISAFTDAEIERLIFDLTEELVKRRPNPPKVVGEGGKPNRGNTDSLAPVDQQRVEDSPLPDLKSIGVPKMCDEFREFLDSLGYDPWEQTVIPTC
jgi:hypothetical protein